MIEVIAIHIPKTAGSSLHLEMVNQYGTDRVIHYRLMHYKAIVDRGITLSQAIPERVTVVQGHLRFRVVEEIYQRDKPRLITFVRNPVDRVISHFNWFNYRHQHNTVRPPHKSIVEYCEKPSTRNRMWRFLEGAPLDDFFFIGSFEQYDSDLRQLGKMLGWKKEVQSAHDKDISLYKKKAFTEINDEVRNRISEMNSLDMELYDEAMSIRAERLKQFSSQFS